MIILPAKQWPAVNEAILFLHVVWLTLVSFLTSIKRTEHSSDQENLEKAHESILCRTMKCSISWQHIGKSLPDISRAQKDNWQFSGFLDQSWRTRGQALVRFKFAGCRLVLVPCQVTSDRLLMIFLPEMGKSWSCWPSQQKPSQSMKNCQKGLKLSVDLSNNTKNLANMYSVCVNYNRHTRHATKLSDKGHIRL